MYSVGIFAKDTVHELSDIPQSSVGAPCPMIIADEINLHVIFLLQDSPADWDGSTVRIVGPASEGEPYAIVTFGSYTAYYHGSPNDETFSGHPLHKRGLTPYGAFEIKYSSWIKSQMEMNRVHPNHHDSSFADRRHFILSFHDSTFECIADTYTCDIGSGSILDAAKHVVANWK